MKASLDINGLLINMSAEIETKQASKTKKQQKNER